MNFFATLRQNLLAARALLGPKPQALPGSMPSIRLILDDLTDQSDDAIVNAADWSMLGGTGVDGAIHEKAGPALGAHILARRLRLEVGQVQITPGFNLSARHILHTCAPVWYPGKAELEEDLGGCYSQCIKIADELGLASICFPLLGAGAFCWPTDQAANVCALAISQQQAHCRSLKKITLCAFSAPAFHCLEQRLGVQGEVIRDPSSLRYHPGKSALEALAAQEIFKNL